MKRTLVVMMAMAMVFFTAQSWAETLEKAHFDESVAKLQQAVAEVKGDTTQIVSILGNVFEGTVPRGGTLTSLCNQNGWNLIVLMGHNNISDPDRVMAGEGFLYPETAAEFQRALTKGKPLYDAWLAKQKTTFRVNRVKVDTAEIDELNIRVMNVSEKLKIKNMEVDQLKIRLAEITEKLKVKQAEIDQLNIGQLNIKQANIDQLRIKQLEIDNLRDLLTQAQLRCAQLEARPPVVQEKVVYRDAGGATVASGGCKDIPWAATGIWADFPDGAVGTETQLRTDGPVHYKYKLVQRKGRTMYATECFKDARVISLQELSAMWNVKLSSHKTYGNVGDGGKHATIEIGLAR